MKFQHIHHVSKSYLNDFFENYKPVFVLNTGRSGSAFIQTIFNHFDRVDSYHEASPNLFLLSNYAFSNQENEEVLTKIFEASRLELILKSSVNQKIYLESNQCLVFYINQIFKIFPKARFVHLTRHPGDFVRSAIMKGWHKNDSVWEMGRIKSEEKDLWNSYSQIEKLGWVWKETHNFIELSKTNNHKNFLTLRLEDLTSNIETFKILLEFVGIDNHLTESEIKNILNVKVNKVNISKNEPENMHKLSSYPRYDEWNKMDKESLMALVGNLCKKYNYSL
ncbi:MAG: sulfotransferase [Mesoflavibacter sp.]|nr:sulfotransferase [Mesoflavibacter sp.]